MTRTLSLVSLLLTFRLLAAGHDISAVRYAPNDSFAGIPAVAFGGNRFLTLWPMSSQIFGAFSDPASEPAPAFVAVPLANANTLRATATGNGYLAIWNQDSAPMLGTFTSQGVLEHSARLDVSTLSSPRMAFNGSHLLIVDQLPALFTQPTTDVSVYDLNGALVRRFPLPVVAGDTFAATVIGNDFAVVTAGKSGINEWRVANDGTIVSTLQIEPPPANQFLSVYSIGVASKNGRIAVAWVHLQVGTLSGAVIEANGSINKLSLPNGSVPPVGGLAILPVGVGFVVVWNVRPSPPDNPAVFVLRIDNSGSLLDAHPIHLTNGQFSAAASSSNVINVALTTPGSAPTTLLATVDANGIGPRPATPAALTPVAQLAPVLTGNGSGFTAAWMEQSVGSRNVVAGRISHAGEPLDGSGITLGQQFASSPAIAHSSSEALVVWSTNNSVLAARLTPLGEDLDPTPISIAKQTFPTMPAIAWNGSRYFVVWTDGLQLFGALLGPDGTVTNPKPLSSKPTISTTVLSVPDVAWDGRQFIVVFGAVTYEVICSACSPPPPDHVRVMRVTATGDAIDTVAVRIPGVHVRAHVASSGAGESLLALDSTSDTSTMIVHGDGSLLQFDSEVPLFHWFSSIASDVAWDGSAYVVGWRYTPSRTTAGWLGAARISQSGVPLGSLVTPAAGADDANNPSIPSAAVNDAGEAAFVFSETAPPSFVSRARLYLMSELASMPSPPPAPRNVVSYFAGGKTLIEWQSDGADGFLLEQSVDFGRTWFAVATTGNVRSTTTPFATIGNLFRVSAFGPGGLSAGTITSIGSPQRRRAERR